MKVIDDLGTVFYFNGNISEISTVFPPLDVLESHSNPADKLFSFLVCNSGVKTFCLYYKTETEANNVRDEIVSFMDNHISDRRILHIEVGDDNWDPTASELEKLVDIFLNASSGDTSGIVATRKGVTAKYIDKGYYDVLVKSKDDIVIKSKKEVD